MLAARHIRVGRLRQLLSSCLALLLPCASALWCWTARATLREERIVVTSDFVGREVAPDERISLRLSRALRPEEGRLALLIGETDVTALVASEPQAISYTPRVPLLTVGESRVRVYLVSPDGVWNTLAEFTLKVRPAEKKKEEAKKESADTAEPQAATDASTAEARAAGTEASATGTNGDSAAAENANDWKVEFTPGLTLNTKGQNQVLTFPREAAPERNPFTDVDGQGNISLKISRNGWAVSNRFDLVGVSFRNNALRFGELRERAPRVDLSSYLVEINKGRFRAALGHVSFGSNRHLINSFSSRGLIVTVPIGRQNEISLAAMNGTSVVGFDNFTGITRRRHNVLSATVAREFFRERPGGLRLEFTLMRGSLLPASNFNQREVNDAERSTGFGLRASGNAFRQRFRYEAGFTRSRFTNPSDPLLEQGFDITPIRPATRYARFAEINFDFINDLKLWRDKALKVTGTYRHEEIEPLFRSVAASTQADRRQHQFEVTGSFGEINFGYGNLSDRDNLNEIPSILRTNSRRNNALFAVPLNTFFTPSKPIRWLPQISYTADHVHQFGAFFPIAGEFRDASQIPDQASLSQSFNALWQLSEKLRLAYRYNRAFQDNRQAGRERADFESAVNSISLGTTVFSSLDLSFELSHEQQKNFEQPRTDRTFRFGPQILWRMPFPKNSVLGANLSATFAGDDAGTTDSRNAEFDIQWSYSFARGEKKFKKLGAQLFVRYANRYGDARDRLFFVNNFNKTQSFSAGLTFNFF